MEGSAIATRKSASQLGDDVLWRLDGAVVFRRPREERKTGLELNHQLPELCGYNLMSRLRRQIIIDHMKRNIIRAYPEDNLVYSDLALLPTPRTSCAVGITPWTRSLLELFLRGELENDLELALEKNDRVAIRRAEAAIEVVRAHLLHCRPHRCADVLRRTAAYITLPPRICTVSGDVLRFLRESKVD